MDAISEIKSGTRFEFGKNWSRFLQTLDDSRVKEAELSLKQMLQVDRLDGKTFLDAGSGSGLFSLAARSLGARVRSFDYDPTSVACTEALRQRFFPSDPEWVAEQANVLDEAYLESIGTFDVVYSWGVLHHTGSMWKALENIQHRVAAGGKLYISIYNDQGRMSRIWLSIKKAYNSLPEHLRFLLLWPYFLYLWGPRFLLDLWRGHPFHAWRNYAQTSRGMSPWRDVVDWVGGYPFEVAKPEEVFDFFHQRGFALCRLKTWAGGHGCNEYVFERSSGKPEDPPVRG